MRLTESKNCVKMEAKTSGRNPKQEKTTKTNNVIEEVLETEKSYISDMKSIVKGYAEFFNSFDESHVFSQLSNDLSALVSFSEDLYKKLLRRKNDIRRFSQSFIDKIKEFNDIYGDYCNIYPLTSAILENMDPNSRLYNFVEKCRLEVKHALPLYSYLLKPVQRVMKYHLLLLSLKADKSLSDADKEVVNESCDKMKLVADTINERKRIQEGYAQLPILRTKIKNLKNPLPLDLVGPVILQDVLKVNNQKRYVVLFENAVLFMKELEDRNYKAKAGILVRKIVLLENILKDEVSFQLSGCQKSNKTTYLLTPKNIQVKEQWVTHIKSLILQNLKVNIDQSKINALFGANVGTKIQTIISAQNLVNVEELLSTNKDCSQNNAGGIYMVNQPKNEMKYGPDSLNKKSSLTTDQSENKKQRRNFDLEKLFDDPDMKVQTISYPSIPSKLNEIGEKAQDKTNARNNQSQGSESNSNRNSLMEIKKVRLRLKDRVSLKTTVDIIEVINRKNGSDSNYDENSEENRLSIPWNKDFIEDAADVISTVVNEGNKINKGPIRDLEESQPTPKAKDDREPKKLRDSKEEESVGILRARGRRKIYNPNENKSMEKENDAEIVKCPEIVEPDISINNDSQIVEEFKLHEKPRSSTMSTAELIKTYNEMDRRKKENSNSNLSPDSQTMGFVRPNSFTDIVTNSKGQFSRTVSSGVSKNIQQILQRGIKEDWKVENLNTVIPIDKASRIGTILLKLQEQYVPSTFRLRKRAERIEMSKLETNEENQTS